VCFVETGYTCYAYNVSKPGGGGTQFAMSCLPRPSGMADQDCKSLQDWYDPAFRMATGDSWAPVGHREPGTTIPSVNLGVPGNYKLPTQGVQATPPVDPYLIWWDGYNVRKNVSGTTTVGGIAKAWSIQRESSVGKSFNHSYEGSLSNTSRAEIFGAVVAGSVTVGAGGEFANSVSWSTGLAFGGEVYDYPSSCPSTICRPYTVAPFVYQAQATTVGGDRYSYLEQDYYLTSFANVNQALGAATDDAEGLMLAGEATPPQAPIVTSPSHPDPNTWYLGNTVTFNWSQPAGDLAALRGYTWALNQLADFVPTAAAMMSTTVTYDNLADGLYYLHIQALSPGIDRSPVTHFAVRVDNGAPEVAFVTDPPQPDGFNDWFISPIAVSLTATDTPGSGVSGLEISTDGTTWQPYTAALHITTDTPGTTLWARGTDRVGNTSEPMSTTLRLDRVAPSTVDSDGYRISYASIITTEVGNAQLVLGGALTDALSGRLQVEVKAGELGLWHTVSAIGELPVPPGNTFDTTMTHLNWIYTPTFSVRGVYPLWGRGVDAAGNYEEAQLMGALWWEPDALPILSESQVSASPSQAYPGDVIAFTIGARNTGYQEAQLLITNTVPVGLTVLPDSISHGGQYDPASRIITWQLYALWPGETHPFNFSARVDATSTPLSLENEVGLLAYWPWLNLPGVPDEPDRHAYATSTTVTVLPGQARQAGAPRITGAAVIEGSIVTEPDVTLLVHATPTTRFLYVKEWGWDHDTNTWKMAAESGWLPFEAADGLQVTLDGEGRYGRYAWTLSEGDGIKYLAVWVADAQGQMSNLNEGNLLHTNLLSTQGQQLVAGQRVQYRVTLQPGALALLNLLSLSGDADLYVWAPRAGFKPHYYSNGVPTGTNLALDTVAFYAPEEGMYVIEVHAVTDAYYRLISAGSMGGAVVSAATQVDPALSALTDSDWARLAAQDDLLAGISSTLPQSTRLSLAEKNRPDHPLSLSTPLGLSAVNLLPGTPEAQIRLYLPQIFR
jgi:uncharacterized repeat protein (TIGR01451 family)